MDSSAGHLSDHFLVPCLEYPSSEPTVRIYWLRNAGAYLAQRARYHARNIGHRSDPSFPSVKASTTRSRENRDRAWRWEQESSDRRPRWSRTLTTAKSQVSLKVCNKSNSVGSSITVHRNYYFPLFHFFQFPHHLFYHVFIF